MISTVHSEGYEVVVNVDTTNNCVFTCNSPTSIGSKVFIFSYFFLCSAVHFPKGVFVFLRKTIAQKCVTITFHYNYPIDRWIIYVIIDRRLIAYQSFFSSSKKQFELIKWIEQMVLKIQIILLCCSISK